MTLEQRYRPILDAIDERYPQTMGRPRKMARTVDAIVHVLANELPWNKLPPWFGDDSTAHRWWMTFRDTEIGEMLRQEAKGYYA